LKDPNLRQQAKKENRAERTKTTRRSSLAKIRDSRIGEMEEQTDRTLRMMMTMERWNTPSKIDKM
jgi:uncharacterized protein YpmS